MDLLFSLLFDYVIWAPWMTENPKLEVRLLSYFPNPENKLSFEVENISNVLFTLKSISIVLKNKDTFYLNLYDLGLGNEKILLSSFYPHKVVLTLPNKKIMEEIKCFKFELEGTAKNKLKVFPINSFKKDNSC